MQDGRGNDCAKAAQPMLLLPTYLPALGGKAAKLLNNSVTHLKLSSLTFIYAVREIKYSTQEFWVAALPSRQIKAASSLCCLVPIITEFWLIYYYIDHLVKQPTYKASGVSPFSRYLQELEQLRLTHIPIFWRGVGSFPCTQGRHSPCPAAPCSPINRGPNDLSLSHREL